MPPHTIAAGGGPLGHRVLPPAAGPEGLHGARRSWGRATAWLTMACAFAFSPPPEVSAQMYCPPPPYGMWDTWLFHDGEEYHLFFLQSEPDVTWSTLGRAVSKDLVHWVTLPPIPTKGAPGEWDFDPTLTGMTVKLGSRYATFYGSATGGVQRIGLMFADSLLGPWTKHPGNPVLVSRPPHYSGADWRDMCTVYEPGEGLWHGYVCAQAGGGEPKLPTIRDKTLVAWVTLANRTQRAGSVLTLDHGVGPGDAFDGIVFGEIQPGKWMAGSDLFRRSEQDQSRYPEETAGPDELVQMAITYHGNEVALYRNGVPYASYTAGGQQEFGDGSAVVMGLRHTGAGVNAPRFFAGAIEEARLYDVALSRDAIAGLRPGEPSDPQPVGLWTFEEGTARDAMGRFPEGELRGGASIADGRLHLDGVDDCLVTPAVPGGEAAIAHLTSRDLLHWEYLPAVVASRDFVDMEVPDYFELNGRHYLLFSSGRTRKSVGGRTDATGTWYCMADRRDGPYRFPADCLLVASGRGRFDNYVGRTIPFRGGRLLYHHTAGGPVTWAAPKIVRQHEDGTLWLQYFSGLSKAETQVLVEDPSGVPCVSQGPGTWAGGAGWMRGESPTAPSALWLPPAAADVMVTCRIEAGGGRGGLAWRWDGAKGIGVVIDPSRHSVTLVTVAPAEGGVGWSTIDDIDGVALEGAQHLRALVRAHRVEVYLNDRWLFGTSLPEAAPNGKVGLLAQGDDVRFADLRVAGLEPMPALASVPEGPR